MHRKRLKRKRFKIMKTSKIQNTFRVILGLFMLYAGIAHLTIRRIDFRAQVPDWLTTDLSLIDTVVLLSGVLEIVIALALIFWVKKKVHIGIGLAIFFILVFPGNINQYVNHIDAFSLNTDKKRLIRLLFQPVLILWVLWSTGALKYLMNRNKN